MAEATHSAAIGHLIGTWNAHDDEATLTRLIHTIADVYDQHLSVDAVKQTGIGIVNAFLPADIAPIPRAIVAATTGQTVQNPIDQGVSNLISGKPISCWHDSRWWTAAHCSWTRGTR